MKAITTSLASLTWNLRKVKVLQETFSSHPKDIAHYPLFVYVPLIQQETQLFYGFLCTFSNYQQGNRTAGQAGSDDTSPQQLPCFMDNTKRTT